MGRSILPAGFLNYFSKTNKQKVFKAEFCSACLVCFLVGWLVDVVAAMLECQGSLEKTLHVSFACCPLLNSWDRSRFLTWLSLCQ